MQDGLQSPLLPLVLAAVDDGADPLTRQRTFDKHHLALDTVADTLGIVVERLDAVFDADEINEVLVTLGLQ